MLARFLDNTRGGVAPLAAVVALPLMVGVGVAMDYSKVNAARSAFQVALEFDRFDALEGCGDRIEGSASDRSH